MYSSKFFWGLASLVFLSLIGCAFALPLTYLQDEPCKSCQGDGLVNCSECGGSGRCWWCGGDGVGLLGWCAACQGSGVCHVCDGEGTLTCKNCFGEGFLAYWNLAGATLVPSLLGIGSFVGFFALNYAIESTRLYNNLWVYEISDMNFWFNPSYMMWLFAQHPQKWAAWITGLSFIFALEIGLAASILITLNRIIPQTLSIGVVASLPIIFLFGVLFYKAYSSNLEKGT